jgi:hypothetical protein
MTRGFLLSTILATFLTCAAPSPASAQTQPAVPAPPDPPAFSVRVFGEAGIDQLSAAKSFNAVFGKDSGPIFGGGAEVVLYQAWFVRFTIWRFKEEGQRAIRLENQTFRLDIPLTVTITPIEVNAGYRFPVGRRRVIVPYVGGGVSSHGYKETSSFSVGDENVDERFTGYQVLGGVEYRLHRSFGVAGEVQYTSVPDALGAGGLSADFDENNLGGVIARVRVLFGR